VVTSVFLALVAAILGISIRQWLLLLQGRKPPTLQETAPVWLSAAQLRAADASPIHALGAVAMGLTLLKEVSGEAALERAQAAEMACNCQEAQTPRGRRNVYLSATDDRFRGIRRCC
jgi:carbon starvation protein